MKNIVRILDIGVVTHNVKCFRFEKPANYQFIPGQATDVSINEPGLEDETRPFTFTSLPVQPYLEFTIKGYPDHHGITEKLHKLERGAELIIQDSWGAIEYKGPGCFIAGGAGITPFIATLRQLHANNELKGNTLIFSNDTAADIIYESELKEMLQDQAIFILTKEDREGYKSGYINEAYLKEQVADFTQHFYLCGPDAMIADLQKLLTNLGANPEVMVFEK